MASSDNKLQQIISPTAPASPTSETYRAKSIATRLTEAEFAEVEVAAFKAGKKVSEWLRDVALGHVHASPEELTDPILLGEIMAMRSLMVNLFARASEGPISSEDLRKMSLYADSIKEQKGANSWPEDACKPVRNRRRIHHAMAVFSQSISVANCAAIVGGSGACIGHIPGVVKVGVAAAPKVLSSDILGVFGEAKTARKHDANRVAI